MGIQQKPPADAYKTLTDTPAAVYLDVRTETEFEQGHPAAAYNVPVVFLNAGSPAQPNAEFVKIVESFIGKDTPVVVGCLSGGRSQRACELLEGAGFTNLVNVTGGFGGQRDRAGNVVAPGWADSNLPVESGQPQGRRFADLAEKN